MIKENVENILEEIPEGVGLVAAAKTRKAQDILSAVEGGLKIVGENYVQEAEEAFSIVGNRVQWHMIGHLQRNKAKKAVRIFDMIETIDSLRLAREVDKCCGQINKSMPVLIEINSGEEESKSGVLPEEAPSLIQDICKLNHIRVQGLMTMGPFTGDPEDSRPYFQKTKALYDQLKALNNPNLEMKYLSMGMSNSYKIALEEGANLIRIGTKIFGPRS